MKAFTFELVTPEGLVFSGQVESVQAPGTLGSFEVLYNHAPLVSTLTEGTVRIRTADGATKTYTIDGGVVEVLQNKVALLAEKILQAA